MKRFGAYSGDRTTPSSRFGRNNADRGRYTFEADDEDIAYEEEIEDNLDFLDSESERLKGMALSMSDELVHQNKRLDRTNAICGSNQ